MMKSLATLIVAALAVCLVAVHPDAPAAKSLKKTIKNPTDKVANDLQVCTHGGPNNTTHAPGFTPPRLNGNGSNCVNWPAGSGSVSPGEEVEVRVNTKHGGKIDDKNTYFTRNDTSLTLTGCDCQFNCQQECCTCLWVADGDNRQDFYLNEFGHHFLTIENFEPVPVVYSNVEVWVYNDNSDGHVDDLDTFDIPIGTLSSQVPPIIELAAFADTTFDLEPFIPETYDLFIADQANSCHPAGLSEMAVGEAPVVVTGIGDKETPGMAKFDLMPSYPNPFNPATTIAYVIPSDGLVRLDIYDVNGRHIVSLVNASQTEGRHSIEWDGRDESGELLASGSYFARLEFEGVVRSRTMVLLK